MHPVKGMKIAFYKHILDLRGFMMKLQEVMTGLILCSMPAAALAIKQPTSLIFRVMNDMRHTIHLNFSYRNTQDLLVQKVITVSGMDCPDILITDIQPSSLTAPTEFWYTVNQQSEQIYSCKNYFIYDRPYPDLKVYIYPNNRCVIS